MIKLDQFWRTSKNRWRHYQEKYFQDFIFIHINKTAGSSIEKALKMPFLHKTASEKLQELGPERWKKRFSFTIVRNPWDRVVSHYHYRLKTNKTGLRDQAVSFEEWVHLVFEEQDPQFHEPSKMFLPQWKWISDESGKCLVNFIGRFESLEKDFATICQRINRQATLPHVKKSNRGRYQDYYDPKTREVVENWFHEDISKFDYAF